jgi:hypothetical protein
MSCVARLLAHAATEIEPEVQRRLQGFLGSFVRAYLPQVWVFQTEDGVATLKVDLAGHVSALAGALDKPDVTIEIAHDRLKAALERTGPAGPPPPGAVKVTPHTAKGKAAFDLVRSRLGL